MGRPRGPQDYRSDADPHGFDRNRARVHRPARSGRTEPPRPQGGGADTRRRVDAKRIDDSVGVREIRIMSQMKYGRVVAGAMMLAAILARPEAASAQLDPLLMIKKGTPAAPVKPNVIFADRYVAAHADATPTGSTTIRTTTSRGGLVVNPWESSISVDPPTSRYRRKYIELAAHRTGQRKYDRRPGSTPLATTSAGVRRFLLQDAVARRARCACQGADRQHQRRPFRPHQDAPEHAVVGNGEEHQPGAGVRCESAAERARHHRQMGGHHAHSQREERIGRPRARRRSC